MKEYDLPELVRIHGEPTNVLLRMDENDVELGRVQAEQGHVRTQADRHTQCRHLDLNTRTEGVSSSGSTYVDYRQNRVTYALRLIVTHNVVIWI